MKKILSLILAIVLAFSTAITAFAQSFVPTADKTAVNAGEDVTITLSFEEAVVDVTTFTARLYFNDKLFSYKESTLTSEKGYVTPDPQKDAEGTYMEITHAELLGKGTVAAGEYAKITFTAKENVSSEQTAEFVGRVEEMLMADGSQPTTENVKITVTVSPVICDHSETETAYTSNRNGSHTVTVTCKKCSAVISTSEETCTKGEDGKCTHCGYVFPATGDEYTITVNVAPSTVDVTFYGDENATTALAAEKVVDKGVSGKYHIYEITVPKGTYSYRAFDNGDDRELGGMTFTAPVSIEVGADGTPIREGQKMTLLRVNHYTNSSKITAVGDYNIEIYPADSPTVVNGEQYIDDNGKVVTATMLWAHGNALLYNRKVTLKKVLAKNSGVSFGINKTFVDTETKTNVWTFIVVPLTEYSLTAPKDASVRFFNQINYFNDEELPATSVAENTDGTVTYILRTALGDNLTYRVSMEGKVTKAGYLGGSAASLTITFADSENPKSTVNKMNSAEMKKRIESSTLVNVNARNELSLGIGEIFRLRSYRGAWQIIDSDTANIMIEPDFNYKVISGGEHIRMTPATNRCTGNAGTGEHSNWMDIEGVSAGITVLEVSYDAIDIVNGTTFTGTYGATDPKRTSLVIIRVGEDAGELSLKAAGMENTWDTEYDTVYTLEDTAAFDFTASLDGAVPEVQLSTDKGMSWKDVSKNEDGSFTAAGLIEGNNILKFTANGKTAYQVVRAAKVTYTVTNQRENAKDIIVGDTVEIKFSGLYQPIAKFSGIYNPGFGQEHKVTYTTSDNAEFVKASGGQYDFITTNKYIVKAIAKGEVKLTGGNVHFNVMGDPEPLGGHRVLTDNGIGTNFNAKSTDHIRDIFPDITIEVKEKEEEEQHNWSDPTYTWSSDNSTCTATRTCSEHESETVTETVNTVYSVVKAATCDVKGEGKYVATFTKFAAAEKTVEIPAIGHKWGKPTYEWSADHSTLTGKVVCENDSNHVHTETVNSTAVTENATCTEKGKVTYTAEFGENKYGFTTQTAVVENAVLGHDWGETEYTWNSDNSEVTAKHTCKRDPAHTEEETVKTVYSVVKAATCEAKGEGKYVATFTNAAFEEQEKTVEIPATDHDWAEPTYEWSSDNKTCTAKRVCKNDQSHIESETVNTVYSVVKAAACEAKGEGKYVATFTNAAFEEQEKTVEIPATDHDWAEPTYEWSSDNKTCTAKRVCKNDQSHIESETVNTVYSVVKAAACEAKGEGKYVATFTNTAFEEQEKTVEIPATDHDWAEPTYEWSSDNKTCTAKRVCKNDKAHEQTQSVNTVSKTLKEATCAEKGSVEYTADFGNNNYGFVKQSKTVETAALGHKLEHHDAKAATCVAEGNVEYWECSVCNKFFSDKEGKNELNTVVTDKDTKNHVGETEVKDYKEATCSESGYTGDTYCKSCGKLIAAGKVSPVVPHKFGEWKVTKQPTKNSAGEKVRYCEVCQYEQKIEIPRLSDGDVIHIGIGDSKGEQNPETGAQVPGGIAAIAVAAAAVIFGKKKRG